MVTSAGQSFEGRIGQEDDQKLVLHTADSLAAPVTIRKDEIDERKLSTTSTMPARLLNTLQKSEILDLLAYLDCGCQSEASGVRKMRLQEMICCRYPCSELSHCNWCNSWHTKSSAIRGRSKSELSADTLMKCLIRSS